MLYTITEFLAEHQLLAGIGAALVILGIAMPYVAGWLRPPESVYLTWANAVNVDMQSNTFELEIVDYRPYQWPHNKDSLTLSVYPPSRTSGTKLLALLSPVDWDTEAHMSLLGGRGNMPVADSRAGTHLSLPGVSLANDGIVTLEQNIYKAQFIEWHGTAIMVDDMRVLITRTAPGSDTP